MEKVFVSQKHFEQIVREQKPATLHHYELPSSIITNQDEYEEWFVPESKDKIYLVPKQKLDFTTFDYLPDMVGFMDDVKYMFDNFNNPNIYSFSKVELSLYTMFVKGILMSEEVKNQLGETFSAFIPVLVKSYSIMKGEHCNLEDLFKTFDGDPIPVKDILPIVARVLKDKITRPQFKLDKNKMYDLSLTSEFKIMQDWLEPLIRGLESKDDNFIINKHEMILLLSHISMYNILENNVGYENYLWMSKLIKKYRDIFSIGSNIESDTSEFGSKIDIYRSLSQDKDSCPFIWEDDVRTDKLKPHWYESGYILGSPDGQKLF